MSATPLHSTRSYQPNQNGLRCNPLEHSDCYQKSMAQLHMNSETTACLRVGRSRKDGLSRSCSPPTTVQYPADLANRHARPLSCFDLLSAFERAGSLPCAAYDESANERRQRSQLGEPRSTRDSQPVLLGWQDEKHPLLKRS